jgi:hypothetical protein
MTACGHRYGSAQAVGHDEVMAPDESVLGGGRYATDQVGHAAMLRDVRRWSERVWAVEGAAGSGGTSPPACWRTASG